MPLIEGHIQGGDTSMPPRPDIDPESRYVRLDLASGSPPIAPGRPVWIVAPGWNGDYTAFASRAETVQRARPGETVLLLDWREAGGDGTNRVGNLVSDPPGNVVAASWVTPLAELVVQGLSGLGISGSSVNVIGHSLGSYIGSEIGRLFGSINRIFALDPGSDINTEGGYNLDGRDENGRRPQPLNNVANFSRSFVSSTGVAGNDAFSGTANESFEILYNDGSEDPGNQHGWIVSTFMELIDPASTILTGGFLSLSDDELPPDRELTSDGVKVKANFLDNAYNLRHEGKLRVIQFGGPDARPTEIRLLAVRNGETGMPHAIIYGTDRPRVHFNFVSVTLSFIVATLQPRAYIYRDSGIGVKQQSQKCSARK